MWVGLFARARTLSANNDGPSSKSSLEHPRPLQYFINPSLKSSFIKAVKSSTMKGRDEDCEDDSNSEIPHQ